MIFKRKTTRYLLIPFCYLLLTSCGGSGGGSSSGSTVSGKLVPDVRSSGYSAIYSDPSTNGLIHKAFADNILVAANDAVKKIESGLKWSSDLPVVFSGCGTLNAFFSPGLDLHAEFVALNSAVDAPAVFGPNITGPAIVICHELTEKNVLEFLKNKTITAKITSLFNPSTNEELLEAGFVSSLVFELQILFHELGHAVDTLLLKDTDNSIKLANYTFPIANTCAASGCDTIANDFADWISAGVLIEVIKGYILTDADAAGNFAKAWLVALTSWDIILGTGGGIAHGYTDGRQINMLCYAYGAIPELRQADATLLSNQLSLAISAKGIDPTGCEAIYNRNNTSTQTLLGSFVN